MGVLANLGPPPETLGSCLVGASSEDCLLASFESFFFLVFILALDETAVEVCFLEEI